jgi:hypothetical protein
MRFIKTMQISKSYVWGLVQENLEVWECVKMGDERKEDSPVLADAREFVREDDKGKPSAFEWQVIDGGTGWEPLRHQAMQKAENVLYGLGS